MTARYIVGDVRQVLAALEPESVDLVLTSPPFLALRSYLPANHPDKLLEIGSEATPGEYIDTLLDVVEACARVLAPHGSMCFELGDTYAGSGGAGGDYTLGGLREGQDKFDGTAYRARDDTKYPKVQRDDMPGGITNLHGKIQPGGDGWPEAKSLCLIPEIFRFTLVYGFNPLTGRQTPRWRARNVIRWVRPNPPVGALGDKFRPATSEMVVVCKGRQRYFDLDAVREHNHPERFHEGASPFRGRIGGSPKGVGTDSDPDYRPNREDRPWNGAGAPPLDWWKISTQPYSESHYATWPEQLCVIPIKAMCPQKVCRVCGKPSERIVETTYSGHTPNGAAVANGRKAESPVHAERALAEVRTLGWTDCGHGSFACSSCGVLVPYDHALRRPGEGQRGETEIGIEAILEEPCQGAGGSSEHAGDMRELRNRVPGATGSALLHPELFGEVGAPGGATATDSAENADARTKGEPSRLCADLGASGYAGPIGERLHDGAPSRDAGAPRPGAASMGDRPPSQRDEGRQPNQESGSGDEGAPSGTGDLPALFGDVPGQLDGYVCPCGSTEIKYVADHWRTGLTLDPFAGSGTTLQVATGHGRDAIGVDLDPRNAELALGRVGPLLLTVETHERLVS